MARITIIPIDNTVYVDGVVCELELSTCNIPANVHALQWYNTQGWVEFVDDDNNPFTPKPPNQEITELPAWATACVALHEAYVPPVKHIFPHVTTPVEVMPSDGSQGAGA